MAGWGVAGAMIGGAVQGITGLLNRNWASSQADRDRQQNYMYNEMAAQNAYDRQRNLYEAYYSPAALLKQYQEAGLSPSLMFGGTPGQGGMGAPQGGGAGGVQSHFAPLSMIEAAQAGLMAAEARKANAETDKIKEDTKLTEAQTTYQNLVNYIKEHTKDMDIKTVSEMLEKLGYEADKAFYEGEILAIQKNFDLETFNNRVDQVRNQNQDILASIALKGAEKELTEEEKKRIPVVIEQDWARIKKGFLEILSEYNAQQITKKELEFKMKSFERTFLRESELIKLNVKWRAAQAIHDDIWSCIKLTVGNLKEAGNLLGEAALIGGM